MKLLNGEIFNAREPLQKLMGKELPVKVAYSLAKMVNRLNEQFKIIEDVRQGLIRKYGEADTENPQKIEVKLESENYPKFVAEMTELMEQDVEVVFEIVNLPVEVDGKQLRIEPNVLMALEKFVSVE